MRNKWYFGFKKGPFTIIAMVVGIGMLSRPAFTQQQVFSNQASQLQYAPITTRPFAAATPRVLGSFQPNPQTFAPYGATPNTAFVPQFGQVQPFSSGQYNWYPRQHYGYYNPPTLSGYTFGGYTNYSYGACTVPSAYGLYDGFPSYIVVDVGAAIAYEPVTTDDSGTCVPYQSSPLYDGPVNQYNYYITNNYSSNSNGTPTGQPSESVQSSQSLPATSDYNAALGDIQEAWQAGSADLFWKHLPAAGAKIAVFIDGEYSYSIDASHFAQITQDAFNALKTYDFRITYLQKHANGSVTGFATHTYAPAASTSGERYQMYLAYTLVQSGSQWVLTSVDSSN